MSIIFKKVFIVLRIMSITKKIDLYSIYDYISNKNQYNILNSWETSFLILIMPIMRIILII
jgi:hypothetical protein